MKLANLIGVLSVLAFIGAAHAEEPIQNIPVDQLGKRYRLVGKLDVPLGEAVIVQGVMVNTYIKEIPGGPALRVQRIMGSATQQDLQIDIRPYYYDWGEDIPSSSEYGGIRVLTKLPNLEAGKTYEMEGYEIGHQNWRSDEVIKKTNLGHAGVPHPYFQETLVVYRAKEIEPLSFGPRDFIGCSTLLAGKAVSEGGRAVMRGDGWVVVVDETSPWPKDIEGKAIETYGMYNAKNDRHTFSLIDGSWHLARLEDQLDRKVELRGVALSSSSVWWFEYRGTALYVENMKDMSGWTRDNHLSPVVIRGVLDKALLPRLDQVSEKDNRDLKEYFIVRNATWEPLAELLAPERPMPVVAGDEANKVSDE